jgi:hypothetical protein
MAKTTTPVEETTESAEIPTTEEKTKSALEPKDFEGKSLMVCMPAYGGQMCAETASRLIDLNTLCTYFGVKMQCKFIMNESLIQRARNYLTHYFEISDFTHMMFIDADIVFDPRDVMHLLYMCGNDNQDIIGGLYPKKHILWDRVRHASNLEGFIQDSGQLSEFGGDFVFNPLHRGDIEIFKPVEVLEVGTGFMMFTKDTLNTYRKNYPQYMYRPDHNHSADFNGSKEIMSYFHVDFDRPETTGGQTNRLLSEDYFFCQMARKAGLHIFACPWMQLSHVGSYNYRGSVQSLAAMEAYRNQQLQATETVEVPTVELKEAS